MVATWYSETILKICYQFSLLLLVASAVLLLAIILMRVRFWIQIKRRDDFLSVWRPIMLSAMYGIPDNLPVVNKANTMDFLMLWNHYMETVGDSGRYMITLAQSVNIDKVVRRMLIGGSMGYRLMALKTIGNMKDSSFLEEMASLAAGDNHLLSMAAADAMAKINRTAAAGVLIKLLVRRVDWPNYKVAAILNELGSDVISWPFTQELLSAEPSVQVRSIRYLKFCDRSIVLPVLRKLVQSDSEEVVSASLNLLGQFSDINNLEIIRSFLSHPKWYVRVQAVTALGNMGTRHDEELLVDMLRDREWWVRYRAAKALAGFAYMTEERLKTIRQNQQDHFARDIISQILAEN